MKKLNNKGFSLVELIVVIAIMAILAVTLAPRLVQYVEKSRKAADGEVVNAIMTATRLGILEEDIESAFENLMTAGTADTIDLITDGIYKADDGDVWTEAPLSDDAYAKQLYDIVGNFELKSSDAVAGTTIKIVRDTTNKTYTVGLYYGGSATAAYDVSDRY